MLIVNVASYCGNTPQYEGLQNLYKKYGPQGLVVLGFPSNEFGEQEPGTGQDIKDFCEKTYGVEFPMYEKIERRPERAPHLQVAEVPRSRVRRRHRLGTSPSSSSAATERP